MPLILPGNVGSATAATGFNVDNSCMFNDGDSAYMHKTPSSAGNRRTFTFSAWIKRSGLGAEMGIFTAGADANSGQFFTIMFTDADELNVQFYEGGFQDLKTNRKFRDVSAWYHILVAVDTTQSTAANRIKIYVNGTQESSFASSDYPSEDWDSAVNNTEIQQIGVRRNGSSALAGYYDGYIAEAVLVDGTQAANTDLGEFDEDSGIWKPIDVSGLTFGTNGFYLDFEASGNLGNDANGGTDLTEVNLAAADQSTDTCTTNFATLNPLHSIGAASELSQGNLEYDPAGHHRIISTIAPTSGKWYAEVKGIDSPDKFMAGVSYYPMPANGSASTFAFGQGVNGDVGRWPNDFGVKANGQYGNNNSWSNYMSQPGNNDIIGIYLDLDNYKLYLSLNGTLGSATGKNLTNNGEPYGFISVGEAGTFQWNFGNPSFALANTAITDDNGFGAFEYSPNITGDSAAKKFYALNTKNLAEYG